MPAENVSFDSPLFLGVEGGATHTTVLLVSEKGVVVRDFCLGPSNLLLLTDAQLVEFVSEIGQRLKGLRPSAICMGLAGARGERERSRLASVIERFWPGVPLRVTDDLETALAATPIPEGVCARVLVLSGTGSCCFGKGREGEEVKVGGRGHVLGDRGSACDIGLSGLRASVAYHDHTGDWPLVGEMILSHLCINDLESLIPWSIEAGKMEIASLAVPVFSAWKAGCTVAGEILVEAAAKLAADALACEAKMHHDELVQFVLSGGTLRKQPEFSTMVKERIFESFPNAIVDVSERAGTWGAVSLAMEICGGAPLNAVSETESVEDSLLHITASPTEQRNPRSMKLDEMSVLEGVELMIDEDRHLPDALLREKETIAEIVEGVAEVFRAGGRLFYVGAGTSGRLGVLDASECPPTFQSPAEQVQGIIAGGYRALWTPVEGAEDDPIAGAEAIRYRGVGPTDFVLGIAASGRTPFVWGALREAKKRQAATGLLSCNPSVEVAEVDTPDTLLRLDVGPEILTGSTRLKAGTATKMVLNMVTTLAMVQTGKVISNLMIDVNASNEKLRDRAIRIVMDLTGLTRPAARKCLEKSGWSIREAVAFSNECQTR